VHERLERQGELPIFQSKLSNNVGSDQPNATDIFGDVAVEPDPQGQLEQVVSESLMPKKLLISDPKRHRSGWVSGNEQFADRWHDVLSSGIKKQNPTGEILQSRETRKHGSVVAAHPAVDDSRPMLLSDTVGIVIAVGVNRDDDRGHAKVEQLVDERPNARSLVSTGNDCRDGARMFGAVGHRLLAQPKMV
jgi:hypothetical protein